MKISGWARTSIAKTKHVETNLASVGRVVSDGGCNAGISLIGKDDAGRMIYIHLSPAEVERVVAFSQRVTK